jgi:protein-tyrosine phosphatase
MVLRVLTVCTANVCRSPMAAAFAQQYLQANGIEALVTSAGTSGGEARVDPQAVAAMEERGLDIAAHRPRLLDRRIVAEDGADLIVTMTRSHLQAVAVTAPGVFQRSFTAKELARRTYGVMLAPGLDDPKFASWRGAVGDGRLAKDLMRDEPGDDVDDPFGRSLAEHRRTADELDALMAVIARSIAAWTTP